MPCAGQAPQKASEIIFLLGQRVCLATIGKQCKVLLHSTDFVEQLERGERLGNLTQRRCLTCSEIALEASSRAQGVCGLS